MGVALLINSCLQQWAICGAGIIDMALKIPACNVPDLTDQLALWGVPRVWGAYCVM